MTIKERKVGEIVASEFDDCNNDEYDINVCLIFISERKSVDLELPNKREIMSIAVPTLEREAPPPRIFKEKTVTKISIGDSDDETAAPSTFKKRKFGIKNVRKRLDDD